MLHFSEEPALFDWNTGVVFVTILVIILLIITLVSTRRAKVARDKARRQRQKAARREGYIQARLDDEEAYIASLHNQGHDGRGRAQVRNMIDKDIV